MLRYLTHATVKKYHGEKNLHNEGSGGPYPIEFPVDGLFNSHIAIFGNTGSGKSNTLAAMFGAFVKKMVERNEEAFRAKCKFLLFDFNGEYAHHNCITTRKTVYIRERKWGSSWAHGPQP